MKLFSIVKQAKFSTKVKNSPAHRWFQQTKWEAYNFFLQRAHEIKLISRTDQKVLLIGRESSDDLQFQKLLEKEGIAVDLISKDLLIRKINNEEKYSVIISLFFTEKDNRQLANIILENPALHNVPFEYSFLPSHNYKTLQKFDQAHFNASHFVSPVFSDNIDVFEIYERSLAKFELKCDIRDYMDLYQYLKQIVEQKIVGDVVEFGSYKGHSGYLIAKVISALKSPKKLYMYDTFNNFPIEKNSLDSFWSKSHPVDFKSIRIKFIDLPNTKFVKGDLTKTFAKTHPGKIALAYIDCDSYRATKYILETVFPKYLSPGGVMVFEDFGHPALLGNRVAIMNYFKHKPNIYRFYSQFSGLLTVIKLPQKSK